MASFLRRRASWVALAVAMALLVACPAPRGMAQGSYPIQTDPYINDYAGLLTTEDATKVRRALTDLRQEKGIVGVVVTIRSIRDYDTSDETIESFATHLFNAWGIGDRTRNDGVLILVAQQDRKVRIELGAGYGDTRNAEMARIISQDMLPDFRKEEYSAGIVRGAEVVARTLSGRAWGGNVALPAAIAAGAAAIGGAATWGVYRFRRYRPRRCPKCGTYMALLDEKSEDVYLDSGQQLEEFLEAVNHDVWKCPRCGMHTVQSFPRLLSKVKCCPGCSYRTLVVSSETLKEPTRYHEGKEQITESCRRCHYHHREIVVLPILQDSSDSDSGGSGYSSSSGGGSSSGSGASGTW